MSRPECVQFRLVERRVAYLSGNRDELNGQQFSGRVGIDERIVRRRRIVSAAVVRLEDCWFQHVWFRRVGHERCGAGECAAGHRCSGECDGVQRR